MPAGWVLCLQLVCTSIASAWVAHIRSLQSRRQLDTAGLVSLAVALVGALEAATRAGGEARDRGLLPVDSNLGACLAGGLLV